MTPAPPTFVVRRPGRWVETPPDRREPHDITLAELTTRLTVDHGPCPFWAPPPVTGAMAGPPLPLDQWVEPVPAFLGHLCQGRLHVEGREGTRLLLDTTDLTLLDRLDETPCRVDELAESLGRPTEDVARRLGRLYAAGRLRLTGPPADDDDPAHDLPTPDPARAGPRALVRRGRRLPRAAARTVRDAVRSRSTPAPEEPGGDDRIPVYAPWQVAFGPNLALAMLLAYARQYEDGALEGRYHLRRLEPPDPCLEHLGSHRGPAVLLCSNYVWSVDHNLDLARRAKALNPDLLVVHGGPSTPKYEGDAEAFLADHAGVADILVRGEGEVAFAEILDALSGGLPRWDLDRLEAVTGTTYRSADGRVVRTADRERVADLDLLPSPFLTGEFDHIDPAAFVSTVSIETNRGCPYGCTFCDWGSATLARVRKFDLDRVKAELDWVARRGLDEWNVTDANFGIISRDVEIAEHIAQLRGRYGLPNYFGFTVAKNTTKHLAQIVEILAKSGMSPVTSLSLQTRDDATLDAVDRSNIKSDHYVRLAAEFRRRNIPLQGDLMLGLPGQTPESYRADLQFMLDHEITARTWLTQLLPNSPMNEPGYRERFAIEVSDDGVVIGTSSFDAADRRRMMRIRFVHTVFEHFGLLRHVLRHLQWEHDLPFMASAERIMMVVEDRAEDYPLLNWVMRYFDLYAVPPLGWDAFYAEVRRLVTEELGIAPTSALDTVLSVQHFLMPEIGRPFPSSVSLAHDYLSYYREATAELYRTGHATPPSRPLESYPPASLEAYGDPADLGNWRMMPWDDSRDESYVRPFWVSAIFELDTPLARHLPESLLAGAWRSLDEREEALARMRHTEEPTAPTPVTIGAG